MSIAKGIRKVKLHWQCQLCNIITANRGGHLERYHDVEVNKFTVRSIIGTEQQEAFFSKYFVQTTEQTTAKLNLIDYNTGMQHLSQIRIRSKKK